MDKYCVSRILEECSIISYLEKKGVYPKRVSGGKFIYHCPIHEGDNEPSFVVYGAGTTDTSYENYFCFGCHSGPTIINLVSDFEKITTFQAYKQLLQDIDISPYNVTEHRIISVCEFEDQAKESGVDRIRRAERLYLTINTEIRKHLEDLNYDDQEALDLGNLFPIIDRAAYQHKADELQMMYDFLVEGGLKKRMQLFLDREVNRLRETWKT